MTPDGGQLSTDALFQILGNSRRRFIIRQLYRTDRDLDLKELAAQIAAVEEGIAPEAVTNEERQRVYVSLYQTHLPTLTESGLIDYDEDRRTLSLRRNALEGHCVTPSSTPWLTGYAVVAAAGLLVGLAFSFGLLGLPPSAAGTALTGLGVVLGALVAAQYARERRLAAKECLLSLVE
ncbi:hypothetical protein SAMN04487949_2321 [Halogranum gelatinilyticum]|uniref:DUF7344 domain-containing protein n=1 Tax=Halogranum gelatinilyticum TaxID=660521 RepID=A0A1G9USY9_9EURY|nr:hypothetical protein [Halogranum gelatinilyticum]SDM62917.1 hypothetical protein SAMN04487949_2321 [Halogranum gelatinilyticum]